MNIHEIKKELFETFAAEKRPDYEFRGVLSKVKYLILRTSSFNWEASGAMSVLKSMQHNLII